MSNKNISLFLLKLEFIKSIKNNGLYVIKNICKIFMWFALYIDDFFIFGNDINSLKKVKEVYLKSMT